MAGLAEISLVAAPVLTAGTSVAHVEKAYPADQMLDAFGRACATSIGDATSTRGILDQWRATALANGWVEFHHAPPPGSDFGTRAAFRAYYSILALNYDLFSSLLSDGYEQIEQGVMHKTVSGREVYLSLLAIGEETPALGECRLFDPLGDGVASLPIRRPEIERWTGRHVKRYRASYRGVGYVWKGLTGVESIRVHFGFDGKPLAKLGAKYDPYALYGLMLVRDVHPFEIMVTRGTSPQ